MSPSLRPGTSEGTDALLADLIEEITDKLRTGAAVDVEVYVARHPERAEQIRELLPALELLAAAGSSPANGEPAPGERPLPSGVLGDFRLLHEVGRGGMGIVYEAEQVSLRRRVALKVLPFAGMLDPRALQRFHNEAQAAACLHHTNIVPVYFVGSERGVHFYAMQFIDGQTLAALIEQQRQAATPVEGTTAYQPPGAAAPAPAETVVAARPATRSGSGSKRGREDFRRLAELGVQAAEALDHAHQAGIVHRDVKPANLMVDVRGNLWVTDFGLAHVQHGEASLTMTGDLVGTLRYMSPEQALAKRVPIDHRTDVYSLGATLYELLTLRPAFDGKDRQELMRQIAFEEPMAPRKLERSIPAELETIVLKAMEKNAEDRYGAAQELAEDLDRFLKDEPIRARRPGLVARGQKWARRHQAVVLAATAALLTIAVVSTAGAALVLTAYRSEKDARQAEAQQVRVAQLEQRRAEDRLRRVIEAWSDSLDFFSKFPRTKDTPELAAARRQQTDKARAALDRLAAEVDGEPARRSEAAVVHAALGAVWDVRGDCAAAEREFRRALVLYDQLITQSPDEARYREARDKLYGQIAVAAIRALNVDSVNPTGNLTLEELLPVVKLYRLLPADWVPPPLSVSADMGAMNALMAEPSVLYQAANRLSTLGRPEEAEQLLGLAAARARSVPTRYRGQVWPAFCRQQQAVALALRGRIRAGQGRRTEAAADYRDAAALFAQLSAEEIDSLALYPDLARLEADRGGLLWSSGEKELAAEAFRRVNAAWQKVAHPEKNGRSQEWAWFLANCPDLSFRKPKEAVALAEHAVTAQPRDGLRWRTHGVARLRADQPQPGVKALEKGLALRAGGDGTDWFFLAMAHWQRGEKDTAREWYGKAVAWMDKHQPQNEELRRFRAEATALLKVEDQRKLKPE